MITDDSKKDKPVHHENIVLETVEHPVVSVVLECESENEVLTQLSTDSIIQTSHRDTPIQSDTGSSIGDRPPIMCSPVVDKNRVTGISIFNYNRQHPKQTDDVYSGSEEVTSDDRSSDSMGSDSFDSNEQTNWNHWRHCDNTDDIKQYVFNLISEKTRTLSTVIKNPNTIKKLSSSQLFTYIPYSFINPGETIQRIRTELTTCFRSRKDVKESVVERLKQLLPPNTMSYIAMSCPINKNIVEHSHADNSNPNNKSYVWSRPSHGYDMIPSTMSVSTVREDVGVQIFFHETTTRSPSGSVPSRAVQVAIVKVDDIKVISVVSGIGNHKKFLCDFVAVNFARRFLEKINQLRKSNENITEEIHTQADGEAPFSGALSQMRSFVMYSALPAAAAVAHAIGGDTGLRQMDGTIESAEITNQPYWLSRMATSIIPLAKRFDTEHLVESVETGSVDASTGSKSLKGQIFRLFQSHGLNEAIRHSPVVSPLSSKKKIEDNQSIFTEELENDSHTESELISLDNSNYSLNNIELTGDSIKPTEAVLLNHNEKQTALENEQIELNNKEKYQIPLFQTDESSICSQYGSSEASSPTKSQQQSNVTSPRFLNPLTAVSGARKGSSSHKVDYSVSSSDPEPIHLTNTHRRFVCRRNVQSQQTGVPPFPANASPLMQNVNDTQITPNYQISNCKHLNNSINVVSPDRQIKSIHLSSSIIEKHSSDSHMCCVSTPSSHSVQLDNIEYTSSINKQQNEFKIHHTLPVISQSNDSVPLSDTNIPTRSKLIKSTVSKQEATSQKIVSPRRNSSTRVNLTPDLVESVLLNVINLVNDDLRRRFPSRCRLSGACVSVVVTQSSTGLVGVSHLGDIRVVLAEELIEANKHGEDIMETDFSPVDIESVQRDLAIGFPSGNNVPYKHRAFQKRPLFKAVELTRDHSIQNKQERHRLITSGCQVKMLLEGKGVQGRRNIITKRGATEHTEEFMGNTIMPVSPISHLSDLNLRARLERQNNESKKRATVDTDVGDENYLYRRLVARFPTNPVTELPVTRALGFNDLLTFGLSSVPDLADVRLPLSHKGFLIIASNAIWKTYDNAQSVVDFVADQIYIQKLTYEQAAQLLWRDVLAFWMLTRSDSPDNAVIAIVPLSTCS